MMHTQSWDFSGIYNKRRRDKTGATCSVISGGCRANVAAFNRSRRNTRYNTSGMPVGVLFSQRSVICYTRRIKHAITGAVNRPSFFRDTAPKKGAREGTERTGKRRNIILIKISCSRTYLPVCFSNREFLGLGTSSRFLS